jgi:hypothetical protein
VLTEYEEWKVLQIAFGDDKLTTETQRRRVHFGNFKSLYFRFSGNLIASIIKRLTRARQSNITSAFLIEGYADFLKRKESINSRMITTIRTTCNLFHN